MYVMAIINLTGSIEKKTKHWTERLFLTQSKLPKTHVLKELSSRPYMPPEEEHWWQRVAKFQVSTSDSNPITLTSHL